MILYVSTFNGFFMENVNVVIKEQRKKALLFILPFCLFLFLIGGLFLGIHKAYSSITFLDFSGHVTFLLALVVLGIGVIISFFSILFLIFKTICPSTITLNKCGIKSSGLKLLNWQEIEEIEYLKIPQIYKSSFYTATVLLSLFVAVNPLTYLGYILRAIFTLKEFESKAIVVKMKNKKTHILMFDEALGKEEEPCALPTIKSYMEELGLR